MKDNMLPRERREGVELIIDILGHMEETREDWEDGNALGAAEALINADQQMGILIRKAMFHLAKKDA